MTKLFWEKYFPSMGRFGKVKFGNCVRCQFEPVSLLVGLPLIFLVSAWGLNAALAEILQGPIVADVVSNYDGDTITVRAHIWPGQTVETGVRVEGVDTPEIRGKCPKERRLAVVARDMTKRLVGARVQLRDIRPGKYAGRVVARVFISDGQDLAEVLIQNALGRPYAGGKRKGWCGD